MNDLKIVSPELALKQGASAATDLTAANKGPTAATKGPTAATAAGVSEPAQSTQVREASSEDSQRVESIQGQVEEAVANLNEYVQSVQRDLQFRLDDNSGKTVITVYDRTTEEVVRQIPDDVALRLARDLQQDEPISLFNAKV